MKLKFSLRSLMVVMLVCGIGFGYVQYKKAHGSDAFLAMLQSMDTRFIYSPDDDGIGEPGAVGENVVPVAEDDPSWLRKLLGNTKIVPGGIRFFDSISSEQSRVLAHNQSGDKVFDLSLRRLKLAPDASYFPANWDSLRAVEFDDVELPSSWKQGIVENSKHIKRMGFFGRSTNIGLEQLKQLTHLDRLVLSNVKIDLNRLPELRKALPETQVIVTNSLGRRPEKLSAHSEHDRNAVEVIRAVGEMQDATATGEGLPEFPNNSLGYTQSEIRQLESEIGFVLPPQLRAYLEVGEAQFYWDHSKTAFGATRSLSSLNNYGKTDFEVGTWVDADDQVHGSIIELDKTWEANPFGTNSSVSLHHWKQSRHRIALLIGRANGDIFIDLESGEIIAPLSNSKSPGAMSFTYELPNPYVITGSSIRDHVMVQLEFRRFEKRRKKDLAGNSLFNYGLALKKVVAERLAREARLTAGEKEDAVDP